MILLITSSYCFTADHILRICKNRNIKIFRYNADLFYEYEFVWKKNSFTITDPMNRTIHSRDITEGVVYKARIPVTQDSLFSNMQYSDPQWIASVINYVSNGLSVWLMVQDKLRLWVHDENTFTKMRQMNTAQKYFHVPDFSIFWGKAERSKQVITKPIIQKPFSDKTMGYCTKVDQSMLDPNYPWFTQEIADGNRDATVLYVNGHVHCYQFATERGELTDWRVTQGTERNQWQPWDAGTEFEQKIDAYMRELGLKYGRLDFIIGGKEPQFLEVNPEGQFGWLDDEKLTLHNEVVDAILDPSSTVEI